jgi:hypothetical protein
MRIRQAITAAVLLVWAAGATAEERSAIDARICPVGPWRFIGSVCIARTPGSQKLVAAIRAWKGGVEAKEGTMKLMGTVVPYGRFGYVGDVAGTAVRPGDTVALVFQHPWTGPATIAARCAAPLALRFVSPAHEEHVAAGGAGALTVRWSGGTPPYIVQLWQVDPHVLVFSDLRVGGTSVSVPLARFSAGERYTVAVQDSARDFSAGGTIDTSSLNLNQNTSVDFIAD